MACSSQVAVANYIFDWNVGYINSLELQRGQSKKSDVFYAGVATESRWEIHLFPQGDLRGRIGWISCHVIPIFGCPLKASTKLSIFADETIEQKCSEIELKENNSGFVLQNIAQKEKIADKRIKLRCELNIKESNSELPYFRNITDLNFVLSDIYRLLENNKLPDVRLLSMDSEELQAHKIILAARSDVFAAMFEHDTEESRNNRIEITDMQAKDLSEMLRYMYSGKLSKWNVELAKVLFVAGDKYKIAGLKEACSSFLRCNFSDENVSRIFALADMLCDKELKKQAMTFIRKNKSNVLTTGEWKILRQERFDLVDELILSMSSY